MKEIKKDEGRPTVMTPETIAKLEEVFAIGGSDEEAIFYAGITKTPFYAYQAEHPEFKERKEALKQKPFLKARQTIVKSLDDPEYAFKYMERKKKSEFAQRTELTGAGGEGIVLMPSEVIEKVTGYTPQNQNDTPSETINGN